MLICAAFVLRESIWGSRRYVAREVLNDDRRTLDKADVFSLGASLYELAGNTRLPDSAMPSFLPYPTLHAPCGLGNSASACALFRVLMKVVR